VAVANGKTTAQACKEAEIVEQTYFRWRKEYRGLQVDQAKRIRELEQENAKPKRLVAELSLDKLVLKDIASGNLSPERRAVDQSKDADDVKEEQLADGQGAIEEQPRTTRLLLVMPGSRQNKSLQYLGLQFPST
jgi:putative transposase